MKLLICAVVLLACVAQTSAIFDLIAKIFEQVKMPGKEVKLLGCYTDGLGGCLVGNPFGGCLVWNQARVFSGGYKNYHPDEVVKKCLEDAIRNGVDTFAIQDQKSCFAADKGARGHYGKYGKRFLAPFCLFGKGGWLSNDVYIITKKETPYKSVGCWADKGTRAITTLEGKDSGLDGGYQARTDAIWKCYEAAKAKGFKYFAVQNGGWCASSASAESRYNMYGKSSACKDGKGGGMANDVYVIHEPVRTDIVTAALPAPLPKCTFAAGDGHGGSEVKIGDQVGDDCLRACVEEKKSDANINVVTVLADGKPGCWCEQAMKQRKPSTKYKSCFLGDKKPAPVDPKPPSAYLYKDWKNKDCGKTYEAAGCHGENPSFDRKDSELLVYWRHDIEWAKNRLGAFGKSLVCACRDAAKKAGMPFFAIHYWGECWGVSMNDMTKIDGGDCVRADFSKKKCRSRGQNICLADKHFMIYAVVQMSSTLYAE